MDLKNKIRRRWEGESVPVRREERGPIHALQREVNRMFDTFFGDMDLDLFSHWSDRFTPRVDVMETEAEVVVTAELPGMEEKDLELSYHEDLLTIRGEKREEREEKENNFHQIERSYGSFQRSIRIPAEVEEEKIGASFKKGILTVHLPKKEESRRKVKKISIDNT